MSCWIVSLRSRTSSDRCSSCDSYLESVSGSLLAGVAAEALSSCSRSVSEVVGGLRGSDEERPLTEERGGRRAACR